MATHLRPHDDGLHARRGLRGPSDDCDDDDWAINPGADEVCNDIDDDCDGVIDLDAVDGGISTTTRMGRLRLGRELIPLLTR